jgi:hypothetical protein
LLMQPASPPLEVQLPVFKLPALRRARVEAAQGDGGMESQVSNMGTRFESNMLDMTTHA